jgi:protocatechuate 3,4-dioxygenase beta subunit
VWCGAQDAPPADTLDHTLTIAGPDEPGDRILLRGTVYQTDGETPAPGVLIYAYHTDNTGVYPQRGDETGNGQRHGHLRGWLITGPNGEYEIDTIRPAVYPSRTEAAHVHLTYATEQDARGRWTDEDWWSSTLFEGDTLIRPRDRTGEGRFANVVTLTPNEDGVLVGERDLRLGRR